MPEHVDQISHTSASGGNTNGNFQPFPVKRSERLRNKASQEEFEFSRQNEAVDAEQTAGEQMAEEEEEDDDVVDDVDGEVSPSISQYSSSMAMNSNIVNRPTRKRQRSKRFLQYEEDSGGKMLTPPGGRKRPYDEQEVEMEVETEEVNQVVAPQRKLRRQVLQPTTQAQMSPATAVASTVDTIASITTAATATATGAVAAGVPEAKVSDETQQGMELEERLQQQETVLSDESKSASVGSGVYASDSTVVLPPRGKQRVVKRGKLFKTPSLHSIDSVSNMNTINSASTATTITDPSIPPRRLRIKGEYILTRDQLRMVFSFLDAETFMNSAVFLVCHWWNGVMSRYPSVWKVLYIQTFFHGTFHKDMIDKPQIKGFSHWKDLFLQRYYYHTLYTKSKIRNALARKESVEKDLSISLASMEPASSRRGFDSNSITPEMEARNIMLLRSLSMINDDVARDTALARQEDEIVRSFYQFVEGYDIFEDVDPSSMTKGNQSFMKREPSKKKRNHFRFLVSRCPRSFYISKMYSSLLADPSLARLQPSVSVLRVVVFGRVGLPISMHTRIETRISSAQEDDGDSSDNDSMEPRMRGRLTITIPQVENKTLFDLQYGEDEEDKATVDFDVAAEVQTQLKLKKPHQDEFLKFVFAITVCASDSPLFKNVYDKLQHLLSNWNAFMAETKRRGSKS